MENNKKELNMTVKEVANITGVTVRTLHYYDEIDLLKPTYVTESGYRMYDRKALMRLQNIMLFKELNIPLKDIKNILDNPDFNPMEAIEQQIILLEMEYRHMGELIEFAKNLKNNGLNTDDFSVFDKSEIEEYKEEAKARWGRTEEYKEYEKKAKSKTYDSDVIAKDFMKLFADMGKLKHKSPSDDIVQSKIKDIQMYISENYYTCTKEIFKGLGEMYMYDERFKKNIDKVGGDGTASFVSEAISIYNAPF